MRSPYTVTPDAPAGAPHCLDLIGTADLDDTDRVAIAAAEAAGARALWRTWLAGPQPRRVYLVQGPRIALGDQVIAFAEPDDLDGREKAALAYSALLWTAAPAPEIQFAELFDEDGTHLDGPDRDRVLGYLAAAPRLLVTTVLIEDVVDGTESVPMDLRTDGTWVWSEGTRHYLDRHRFAPDPSLLQHIAAAGYAVPPVGPAALHRALAAVSKPA
ncbi:hypothetical protein BJ973_003891 [Actinoplanes tereljensis]|uniref:Uncharacterized protein n=1 Tax=Paractinoplanes tereljensis TaxID=571912 RepID=A0A919NVQ8_9ACTN|nr:hypothetical protein [Actinoplanes tereljensis]GIF25613.1 hypothetical protein Ate02nite_83430 [Actinoplanes tereljensis]